jgi:hypothetical protein
MTGKQTAVMWLGLLLIVTRLFTTDQWSELWGTISTKTPAQKVSIGTQGSNGSNSGTIV